MNFAIERLFTVRSGSFTALPRCVLSSRTFDLPFTSDSSVESPSAAKFKIPSITERKLEKSPFCSVSRSARQAWLETLKPLQTSSPTASEVEPFPLSPVGMVRSGSFTALPRCVLSSRTFDLPFTSDSSVESPSAAKFKIPSITERKLEVLIVSVSRSARQAWLETLKPLQTSSPTASEVEPFPLSPVGMVDLHPDVFAVSNSPFDTLTSSLSVDNPNLSNPEDTINWDDLPNLAIHLACSAYANHVEAEQSPEASMYSFEAVAPRATHPGRGLTLMPLHGLNVWSMVHHDTLVLSLACLEQLESRLLTAQRRLVRDKAVEPPNFHPTLSEALALSEQSEPLENDADGLDQSSRRHFSDRLESVYAKRVKLS
ncbi:hypothetical protein AHF37_08640 [Paragonimus kellicotti]|nr:hypothetical protein AHF37_08640 [Paragonimus kellicotti]